jgi:CheY-like chemotaxis protein
MYIGVGQVDTAENGAEAIEKMEKNRYSLVITDIKMPVMNGMDLFQRVKQDENLKNVPFIFMTGNIACTTTDDFLENNKLPSINKPFAVSSLVKIIRSTLLPDGDEK